MDVFVAKQPIYDSQLAVRAYELLYRNSTANRADFLDGDQATSRVLVSTFLDIGLEDLVGDAPVFVNFTRGFLTGRFPLPFGHERVVLEVLEDIEVDEELLGGLQQLSDQGYRIALDDFLYRPELDPLVEIADIVKVDLMAIDSTDLRRHVAAIQKFPVQLLAEKVETHEDYERCKELGFELFQGYFFCKPQVVGRRRLPNSHLAVLQLLSKLYDPATTFKDLETLISKDVALSYRLLRYINSAHVGLSRTIESIMQAITLLGLRNLRRLVTLVVMTGIKDKPPELIVTAMTRAKMCELLGADVVEDGQSFFTVGLFSVLDALLDAPMETVINELPLANEIKSALLKGQDSELGQVLSYVKCFERGQWDSAPKLSLSASSISSHYLQAVRWAREALAELIELEGAAA